MSATATGVHTPRVSYSCPLSPEETLHDQQVGLAQAPLKSLLLLWVLVYIRPCVHPLRVDSVSPSSVELLQSSPNGLQSQILWGLLLLMPDP